MPRTVRQLMGSRNAKPVVLDIIAVTRIGHRVQRQEQKKKSQERKMDGAWGLDENRLEGIEEEDAE